MVGFPADHAKSTFRRLRAWPRRKTLLAAGEWQPGASGLPSCSHCSAAFVHERASRVLRSGMPATAESNAAKGATALKGRGNDDFRAGRFAEARKLYSKALQLVCPDGPEDDDLAPHDLVLALRSNSAECALRLNDWEAAHAFATAALQLDARHEKSQARLQRAQLALDMLRSVPEPQRCTQAELRRAVSSMLTLRSREASLHDRALCTSVDGVQSDKLFDIMALLTPSVYSVMADIVDEELNELPVRLRKQRKSRVAVMAGCLTSALCSTNLRDRGATGPAVDGNMFSTPIDAVDSHRCIEFLRTGVWPKFLKLHKLLFSELERDGHMLEVAAKPLFRFTNLLLAAKGCASYILAHHCTTAAEVQAVSRLMSLGDSEQADQLEGLTNQAAAILAVVAEEEGNTQYEPWLCQHLSEQQVMMYTMMAKPAAKACLARGRGLTHAEFSNEVRASASMSAASNQPSDGRRILEARAATTAAAAAASAAACQARASALSSGADQSAATEEQESMPKKKKAAPPKAGEDEAPAPKKSKEQAGSAAAAETPWKRYFARRDAALNEKAPGPFKGLGFMLIRGMAHTEEERYSDEEDAEEEEKCQDEWTDAEMDYMRWVIITQRRADELETMQELVLGAQAGDSMLMFNTSFSYEIMDSFGELASEVKQTKVMRA